MQDGRVSIRWIAHAVPVLYLFEDNASEPLVEKQAFDRIPLQTLGYPDLHRLFTKFFPPKKKPPKLQHAADSSEPPAPPAKNAAPPATPGRANEPEEEVPPKNGPHCPTEDMVLATPKEERWIKWDDGTCKTRCGSSKMGKEAPWCWKFLLDSKTGCGSEQGCTRCDVVFDWDVAKAARHLFNSSASCEGCMEFWLSSEDVKRRTRAARSACDGAAAPPPALSLAESKGELDLQSEEFEAGTLAPGAWDNGTIAIVNDTLQSLAAYAQSFLPAELPAAKSTEQDLAAVVLAAQRGDMSQMRAVLSQKSSQFYRLRRALGADYGTSAAVHIRALGVLVAMAAFLALFMRFFCRAGRREKVDKAAQNV